VRPCKCVWGRRKVRLCSAATSKCERIVSERKGQSVGQQIGLEQDTKKESQRERSRPAFQVVCPPLGQTTQQVFLSDSHLTCIAHQSIYPQILPPCWLLACLLIQLIALSMEWLVSGRAPDATHLTHTAERGRLPVGSQRLRLYNALHIQSTTRYN
jgi:hypothetical protein